ncbi:6-phosphogluconate dehydrogenase [Aspergillus karnatakaensis]|uniref:DUF1932 domain-containing protein n=1 Tax=Aspergillus karnatakaensis TaxID=1810916 RepID=UPI003CCD0ABE
MATQPLTIAILSIGEMGLGIANLLLTHGYKRARSAGITLHPNLPSLLASSSILLSIVPPKDAYATAQRVLDAFPPSDNPTSKREDPLYYLDLNATSPSLATRTASLLSASDAILFLDGGIIGGPPVAVPVPVPIIKNTTTTADNESDPKFTARGSKSHTTPSIPLSGPVHLPDTPVFTHLSNLLHMKHISEKIGAASGVKMCFASLTKGVYALAIQSYVTADSLGVYGELKGYMEEHNPGTKGIVDGGVVGMPPKAWRWVGEMRMIAEMMGEEGGWRWRGGSEGEGGLFEEIAEVYRVVAEDTELGKEVSGRRERGTTVEDVVRVMREGMERKKDKLE